MTRIWGFSRILATGAPAPGATITIFDSGTINLATIFADNLPIPTVKANPFTADATGYYFFYTGSRVDVQVSGAGITTYVMGDVAPPGFLTLNGLTADVQTFVADSAGVDFAIVSAGSTHTFSIPNAGPGIIRGLVTAVAQTFAGAKTFSTPIAPLSGGTGINASTAANGRLLIGNGAGFTLAPLTGTANQVVVTNAAGAITLSLPQSLAPASTPVFTGLTLTGIVAPALVAVTAGGFIGAIPLSDGQVIIGRTNLPPGAAFITGSTNVVVTPGPASITISLTGVVTSLNALTGAIQTFAVGVGGNDFNISSVGTTHTFNIPDASSANRGLVTTGVQTIAGTKTFTGVPNFGTAPTYNPGTSTGAVATVSGRLVSITTPVSSAAPGPTDLLSYPLVANTLNANQKAIRVTVWGTTAANANVKTITVNFGATSITTLASALNNGTWRVTFEVIRTGAATQLLTGQANNSVGGTNSIAASPTETLAGSVTIKCTATSAANADVVQQGLMVEVIG